MFESFLLKEKKWVRGLSLTARAHRLNGPRRTDAPPPAAGVFARAAVHTGIAGTAWVHYLV